MVSAAPSRENTTDAEDGESVLTRLLWFRICDKICHLNRSKCVTQGHRFHQAMTRPDLPSASNPADPRPTQKWRHPAASFAAGTLHSRCPQGHLCWTMCQPAACLRLNRIPLWTDHTLLPRCPWMASQVSAPFLGCGEHGCKCLSVPPLSSPAAHLGLESLASQWLSVLLLGVGVVYPALFVEKPSLPRGAVSRKPPATHEVCSCSHPRLWYTRLPAASTTLSS